MQRSTSLQGWILALGCSLLGTACGGSGTDVAAASTSGTGGSATSTASATASGTGSGGEGGQSVTATTGASTGTGGSAPGGITPTLQSMQFFVNCQPIVGPDPIHGSFTAKYANSASAPASATITSAKLTLVSAPNTLVWPFTVSPAGGGPVQPGSEIMVAHTKEANSGSGEGQSPCNFCNGTWTLAVTWDLGGGKSASDTLPTEMVGCAF